MRTRHTLNRVRLKIEPRRPDGTEADVEDLKSNWQRLWDLGPSGPDDCGHDRECVEYLERNAAVNDALARVSQRQEHQVFRRLTAPDSTRRPGPAAHPMEPAVRASTAEATAPIVGRAPSVAGGVARGVADSPVARRAAEVPAVVRCGVDSPVVRGPISTGVEAVRHDARTGVAVAGDILRSAPRDAMTAGRAGIAVARVARPVMRAVSDRMFAGVPNADHLAHLGANAVASFAARAASGEFLNFSAWKRFGKYRLPCEP